jgi:small subunit ribosomal protein S8
MHTGEKYPVLERQVGSMVALTYPLGDFLIRIKNAVMAGRKDVAAQNTKLIHAVAKTLKSGGYLEEVKVEDGQLKVKLAYRKKQPVILDVSLVSTPGLRVYMGADELEKRRGPQTLLISTSKGIMLTKDAVRKNLGGEVIAEIL